MLFAGKLEQDSLHELVIGRCGAVRPEVSTGPGFGVDVSVIQLPRDLVLAVTSDPLSLIPSLGLQESAWLSVHLMANDMATTGFAPMYAQMVLNLSNHLSRDDFNTYWHWIDHYCSKIGVAITGGHTGGTEGQHSTIAGGGTMMLTAPASRLLTSKHALAGNYIVATGSTAMSSAAILAMSFPETVKNKLGTEVYHEGAELFYRTSSLDAGLTAGGNLGPGPVGVTAMHDVTEGGVLGAIYEMAVASGNGVLVDSDRLPVCNAAVQICNLFEIDHRFCIGAGSMIIAVEENELDALLKRLHANGIAATGIGRFTNRPGEYRLIENGTESDLPYYSRDPYWAAFYKAYKSGWQ